MRVPAVTCTVLLWLMATEASGQRLAGAHAIWQLGPTTAAASAKGHSTFLVYLRPLLPRALAAGAVGRGALVAELQQSTWHSQAAIRDHLTHLAAEGHVSDVEPFWIFNGLAVTGDAEAQRQICARADVEAVMANRRRRLLPAPDGDWVSSSLQDRQALSIEWGLLRVGAPQAWAMGITGRGVTVANTDTGVDWTHPALRAAYRGRDGNHTYNWFDATGAYASQPADGHGHGTHTMGLLVGREAQQAIGIAPDAQWIAVKVFDDRGETTDVWLHRAFQWIMAPTDLRGRNPRPDLAPRVVSNSWGDSNSGDPSFLQDVAAWRAAGILPVFAAGNDDEGTGVVGAVRTPGGYAYALAVGATDRDDSLARYSQGGPGFFVDLKPNLVAPGSLIRSTWPRGEYRHASGTSMSTPLVAGAAALVWQADPQLSVGDVQRVLEYAARDLGAQGADPRYGWGLLDAAQAVRWALSGGGLHGLVYDNLTRQPAAGAVVTGQSPRRGQAVWSARTDAHGVYTVTVPAGVYDVQAQIFGRQPQTMDRVQVVPGFRSLRDFRMLRLPSAVVRGRVVAANLRPVSRASVQVIGGAGAPRLATDEDGAFESTLPVGQHALWVTAPGFQARKAVLTVGQAGGQATIVLEPGPRVLLVDADNWQQQNVSAYFGRALEAAGYSFDTFLISQLERLPSLAELSGHDIVVWAHPVTSPGSLNNARGDEAVTRLLTAYLEQGGRLLLVGENIANWDSAEGPLGNRRASTFVRDTLRARFVKDRSEAFSARGAGPLQGLDLRLDDVYGHRKPGHVSPDVILAAEPAAVKVEAAFEYADGGVAGLAVQGSYRLIFLAFGLESAGPREAVDSVLDRAISWLYQPLRAGTASRAVGDRLPLPAQGQAAGPGSEGPGVSQSADGGRNRSQQGQSEPGQARERVLDGSVKRAEPQVAMPGETIVFAIEVRNASQSATSVRVSDRLPPGLEYIAGSAWSGSGGDLVYDPGTRGLSWQGPMPGRSIATLRYRARLVASRPAVNVAEFSDGRGEVLHSSVTVRPGRSRLFLPLAGAER
jgi:uncharacterized repeat protein (TIGR01451 family)